MRIYIQVVYELKRISVYSHAVCDYICMRLGIQYMDVVRRHYNYHRKYTFAELTGFFKDDGHIYIQGYSDAGMLKYITVSYLAEMDLDNGEDEDNLDEEDIEVPAWMVPDIKDKIMKNELSFMLNRPSDDSNNATLASVKPHGPQDEEE